MPTMYPPQDGALFQGPATETIYRATAASGTNIAAADQGFAIAAGWSFQPVVIAGAGTSLPGASGTVWWDGGVLSKT